MKTKTKEKKGFRIPHVLYIMIGLLVIMSLLTYVIPAGEFGVDANGHVNANEFRFLPEQTPVSLKDLFFMILQGLNSASTVAWVVLVSGANMNVILDTGAIDKALNFASFKLKKSSTKILVPVLFMTILYIAAFASTDALIAVVPIGVLFAKRMRLDPISALAVSFFPSMIGFGMGTTIRAISPQALFGIIPMSGFGMRMILLNIYGLLGLWFAIRYIKKVQRDPSLSLMPDGSWQQDLGEEEIVLERMAAPIRSFIVLFLMILEYIILVIYFMFSGENAMEFIVGVFVVGSLVIGFVGKMEKNELANSFAKGIADMAFVVFIIGLASTMQIIMREGHIIDTIIYTMTRPLMGLNKSISAVGIAAVITIINPIIPSVMAKAAALVPIILPLSNALGIDPQVACEAFLIGDAFTNMISPALGWTMGALTIAKVPYDKWVKWVLKPMIAFVLLGFVTVYVLDAIGWTGL